MLESVVAGGTLYLVVLLGVVGEACTFLKLDEVMPYTKLVVYQTHTLIILLLRFRGLRFLRGARLDTGSI